MANARTPELFSQWCKLLLDADKHTGRDKRLDNKEKKDGELVENDLFLGQSAFLGPTLWDKTLPVDVGDFQLEYMDLDEFLNENGLVDGQETNGKKESPAEVAPAQPAQPAPAAAPQQESPIQSGTAEPPQPTTSNVQEPVNKVPFMCSDEPVISKPKSPQIRVDFEVSPTDLALATIPGSDLSSARSVSSPSPKSPIVDFEIPDADIALVTIPGQEFDPKKRAFSEEELRPQPMIKKSKKVFVAEDLKDDKYWARRKKNNVAAKRSRDARQIKENQIAMRAAFLERENDKLKEELDKMKNENKELKSRLTKYEPDVLL